MFSNSSRRMSNLAIYVFTVFKNFAGNFDKNSSIFLDKDELVILRIFQEDVAIRVKFFKTLKIASGNAINI